MLKPSKIQSTVPPTLALMFMSVNDPNPSLDQLNRSVKTKNVRTVTFLLNMFKTTSNVIASVLSCVVVKQNDAFGVFLLLYCTLS